MYKLPQELLDTKFDISYFVTNSEKAIVKIKSCNEMIDCIIFITRGFVPFNPPEPLRSIFKLKFEELKMKFPSEFNGSGYLKIFYDKVSGEYKPTPPLPDGAMY